MSPRKTHYRIPGWKVQLHRKKSKKLLFGPYTCPQCIEDKLKIKINKVKKEVISVCTCGLESKFEYVPIYDPVDYYQKLKDRFDKNKNDKL